MRSLPLREVPESGKETMLGVCSPGHVCSLPLLPTPACICSSPLWVGRGHPPATAQLTPACHCCGWGIFPAQAGSGSGEKWNFMVRQTGLRIPALGPHVSSLSSLPFSGSQQGRSGEGRGAGSWGVSFPSHSMTGTWAHRLGVPTDSRPCSVSCRVRPAAGTPGYHSRNPWSVRPECSPLHTPVQGFIRTEPKFCRRASLSYPPNHMLRASWCL